MPVELLISHTVCEKIRTLASGAYPEEGCGILLKRSGSNRISDAQSIRNMISGEKAKRFFMIDPLELAEIEKKTENEGLTIAGFYHTHPDSRACFSKEDEEFMVPGMFYMILSVKGGRCDDVRIYIKEEPGSDVTEAGLREAE